MPELAGRPLRLAHLTTVDMSLALLLATELRVDVEAGHEVFALSAPGRYVPQVEALGVRHVAVPSLTRSWRPAHDLRAARELWTAIRSLRLDVLHAHNPKTGVLGRILGRMAGVPVVVNTCHGLWADAGDPLVKRALVYGVEAFAAQLSHLELYQNAEDRRTLRWAVPARRSRVVGNGVDLERFRFDPEARRRVREEWGISDDELLVGGIGRRVAEKGIVELATVAERLRERARFVWIGPEDPEKPDRVDAIGGALAFIDERSDMPAVYSALDVFVLPSHREGFSRSAMEAAACGRPMVLSDIRGCREIGQDGEHLLLAPPGDTSALASAVERLVDDAGLRSSLGEAAAARARAAFDQRAVAGASLAAYAEVAHRRGLRW